jgi:hypothetical protein
MNIETFTTKVSLSDNVMDTLTKSDTSTFQHDDHVTLMHRVIDSFINRM